MKCQKNGYEHNARCRYTSGFMCEDCHTWFDKDSPTYRRTELLSSIWCVLSNISAESTRGGGSTVPDADAMRDKIGIDIDHDDDYEDIIAEAEIIMAKYGKDSDSATLRLGQPKPGDAARMKLYAQREAQK